MPSANSHTSRSCVVTATARAVVSVAVIAMAVAWPSLPSHALTLQEALAAAYKNNPQLDAERARQRAVDEEVARANSGYRPAITGTASVGYQNLDTKPQNQQAGETHPKTYGLRIDQPLFDGFRTRSAVRVAEASVRAGRETLRQVEQTVLLSVVQSYMDVVRDQAIIRLRENNVNVLSRELRATQDRFAVGEVTRTDVAQAQARRAGAVSALDLARANLKTSRGNFERFVGFPPNNLVEPRPHSKALPRTVTEAISIGVQESPLVISALYNEDAARHQVDQIRSGLLPQVNLQATYNRSFDTSRILDESETTAVTGQLAVPLYEGGEIRAQVRQAKQTHVQRLQQVEQVRTEVQAAIVAAWSQLEAARAAVESDQAQVQANQIALTGVREEEKVGQRTLLDVLNAEQELLNAQVQLVTDQRNLVVASYNLLGSVGRLSAAELAVTNTIYDPDVHYHEVRRKWWGISITRPDGRLEIFDLWHSHGQSYGTGTSSRPTK